jgi:hypothetical protein
LLETEEKKKQPLLSIVLLSFDVYETDTEFCLSNIYLNYFSKRTSYENSSQGGLTAIEAALKLLSVLLMGGIIIGVATIVLRLLSVLAIGVATISQKFKKPHC